MANFQSLADWQQDVFLQYKEVMGGDDFNTILQALVAADWDLNEAIMTQSREDDEGNAEDNQEDVPVIPLGDDFATLPSESSSNVVAQFGESYSAFYNSVSQGNDRMVTLFQERHVSTEDTLKLPELFIGNLSEAIHHAYTVKKRPLLFYIDNRTTESSDKFAQNILSNELISEIINKRYTLFLWDVSSMMSRGKILHDLEASHMTCVRTKIEGLLDCIHAFPIVLAVSRKNNSATILEYCDSGDRIEQVYEKLITGADLYDRLQERNVFARMQRDTIRSQQEEEYQRSLEDDKRRRAEQILREQEEQQQRDEEMMREIEEANYQENLKNAMPNEPEQTDDTIVTVRFKFPNRSEKTRKFRKTESLQTLIDFLSSGGWSSELYNFINSDRKNVCDTFELTKTFEQAVNDNEWAPRETIMVANK